MFFTKLFNKQNSKNINISKINAIQSKENQADLGIAYPEQCIDGFRLICEEEGVLTVHDTIYKYYDIYYLQNGKLYRVSDLLNDPDISDAYRFFNHALVPEAYFKLANALNLKVDQDTYIHILCMFADQVDDCFPDDCTEFCPSNIERESRIHCSYLPEKYPEGWNEEELLKKADMLYREKFIVD